MNCSDLQSILRGAVDGDLLEAKVMTENEIEGTMHGLSLTGYMRRWTELLHIYIYTQLERPSCPDVEI
jgi:hypothetical protein